MLLEIRHRTQYRYAGPVRESLMEVWQQPQRNARQSLAGFELSVEPAAQVFSYSDSFGNVVHHFDVPQAHERLTIVSIATVETSPAPELPAALDMAAWQALDGDGLRGDCYDFLRHHGLTRPTPLLKSFEAEKGIVDIRRLDPLSAVRELSRVLYESFAYEPGATDADSPIDHALSSRSGVCQDFSQIMIAICRDWGIPARYVSGYLFTGRDDGDRSSSDASHAWVEVFLPGLRWVGFDPTNNLEAGERHVTVAVGRDYNDVPPSRGVYKGDADSDLYVAVTVSQTRRAANEPELVLAGRRKPAPQPRRPGDAAYRDYQQQQQQQQ